MKHDDSISNSDVQMIYCEDIRPRARIYGHGRWPGRRPQHCQAGVAFLSCVGARVGCSVPFITACSFNSNVCTISISMKRKFHVYFYNTRCMFNIFFYETHCMFYIYFYDTQVLYLFILWTLYVRCLFL